MTKNELIKKIEHEESSIEGWSIALGYLARGGFVLGCYFDQPNSGWKIYETDERGFEDPLYRAESEEEAYDKLFDLIMIHKKLHTRLTRNNIGTEGK